MSLVPSLLPWLQPFFQFMTAPTAASLQTVLAGWILARRHTVSSALLIQEDLPKHFSAYHRLFAAARWSLDAIGLALLKLIRHTFLAPDAPVFLVVDDTLCRKRGRRVYGAGMHYDPLLTGRKLSNANRSLKSRGHCWVVLGLVLQFPFRRGHYYCLPLLFRLCLNHKSADKHRRVYRSRPQLAMQMLGKVCSELPQVPFHLLVDSAYGGQQTLRDLPGNCQMTARWILNARLNEPAPPPSGARGRRPKRGRALGKSGELLDPRSDRTELQLYGRHQRLRVTDVAACLFTVPERLLRVVASEPLSEGGRPRSKQRAVYYSTVWAASAQQVLSWYAMRWSIEVTFHDAKQQLGLAQPQGWSERAVRRLAPTLLLLYSVVVLWFAAEGHRHYRPRRGRWYPAEPQPSFAEMLATLRQQCLEATFSDALPADLRQRKWWQTLLAVVRQAA
jgi:hypothetical protein